jgi:hypothetical protein
LVFQRAGGRCEYCHCPAEYCPDPFSVDHVVPQAAGGTNQLANLALSCLGCNNLKHTFTDGVDPITGEMARLYHPREDSWHEHFVWSEDRCSLIGISAIGRATISRLRLNRAGVVNLRALLVARGEHPFRDR